MDTTRTPIGGKGGAGGHSTPEPRAPISSIVPRRGA
jgi:hypothetical protein